MSVEENPFLVDTASAEVLERLIQQLGQQNHNLIAFVGAGASRQGGLPLWTELMVLMDEEVQAVRPRPQQVRQAVLANPDLLWQAELFRLELERAAGYERFLRRTFRVRLEGRGRDVIGRLVMRGFRHFVTTNYDTFLEQALDDQECPYDELDWTDRQECRSFFINSLLSPGNPFIIHIHGRSDYPRTVVLTHRDYVQRYVQSTEYVEKLSVLFATTRVVFIGFSLDDPDLKSILRQVNSRFGTGDVQHFALLGTADATQVSIERERLERQYGISPVFYKSDNGHAALKDVLERLPQHGVLKANAAPTAAETAGPPPLKTKKATTAKSAAAVAAAKAAPSVSWNDDPNKGRFGGSRTDAQKTRDLSARFLRQEGPLYHIQLTLKALNNQPIGGPVTFYLHPTFPNPVKEVPVTNPLEVTLEVKAYGAFTVGLECDNGQTRLELDLAAEQDLAAEFRVA